MKFQFLSQSFNVSRKRRILVKKMRFVLNFCVISYVICKSSKMMFLSYFLRTFYLLLGVILLHNSEINGFDLKCSRAHKRLRLASHL